MFEVQKLRYKFPILTYRIKDWQLPISSMVDEWYQYRKALLAKPNPGTNYFYFILGDLTKIAQCMTSFSKIAQKKKKKNLNKHCHVLHSVHWDRLSKLLIINHTIGKNYFKDSFWDYFSFNKILRFSFIS